MLGKLIWNVTGDEIVFSVTYPDLFEYWTAQINSAGVNVFHCSDSRFDFDLIAELQANLDRVQKVSSKIPFAIDDWYGNVIDQSYLNKLHRQWVQTGLKYPNLTTLLKKLDRLDIDFRDVNANLHRIENAFRYEFINYNDDPFQTKNIFGSKIIDFGKSNIELKFDNLGRSSWEKFCHFDDNAIDTDTNNFDMLSGKVSVSLSRPFTQSIPVEYLNWCRDKGVPATGRTISLGNIVDLQSHVGDLRRILIRNTHEQSNTVVFEICSR